MIEDSCDPPVCPCGHQWDHVRTWAHGGFRLDLWTAWQPFHPGASQTRVAYRLTDGGETIFEGDAFGCSPMHSVGSDACVAAILDFLSLRPGDTDPEFFTDDTPRQKAWREERAEDLSHYALELEYQLSWDAPVRPIPVSNPCRPAGPPA